MAVIASRDEIGPCRQRLKIEVPEPAVSAENQRIVADLKRRRQIPGFRRGRVPSAVIEKRFAKDIRETLIERLVPRYWHQAEAEGDLQALMPPTIESVDLTPGGVMTFVATVEIRPEITLGDLDHFELPEMSVEVGDEEVDQALQDIRRSVAPWKPAERAAAEGDLVTAHLFEIGEQGGEGEGQVIQVEIGDRSIWDEVNEALIGASADQEVTFERTEGQGEEEKVRHYRLKVTAIKERDLPALDDDLARKVSQLESLEELRVDLKRRLERGKQQELRRRQEGAVLDQLRERHAIPLPAGVVDHETDHLLREYAETLAQRGVDLEHAAIDWEELAKEMRPQAERRVHARLLLDAVAASWNVKIDENEFQAVLAGIGRSRGRSAGEIRQQLDQEGRLESLRTQLRRDKALDRLLGKNPDAEAGATPTTPEEQEG